MITDDRIEVLISKLEQKFNSPKGKDVRQALLAVGQDFDSTVRDIVESVVEADDEDQFQEIEDSL